MIIKELYIGRFGKLQDISFRFKNGLNVIYGENEAGKTTLQAFIKAMLYGLNARKKSIRDNERKRYLPWSGERASGTLTFEDSLGTVYLIKKGFGSKKAEDEQTVIHSITGKEAEHIDFEKPGMTVLGIGEESFEKTICIKQLSSQIIQDKEDEIMQRLTNLHQSGDEDTSYNKAIRVLEDVKRKLENKRCTGKLDKLKEHREILKEESRQAFQRHEEIIESEILLKELYKQKSVLLQKIEELENKKERIRKYKLYQEYKKLIECREKINFLTEKKEELRQFLMLNGEEIEASFLSDLEEKYSSWNQFKIEQDKTEFRKKQLEEEIKENQVKLEELAVFENFGEQETLKLISYINENKMLREKIVEIQEREKEIEELEGQLLEEEKRFREISVTKEVDKDFEASVYQAREKLKELQYRQSDGSSQKKSMLLKKEILDNQAKGLSIKMGIGLLIALGGIVGGLMLNPILYGLCILGLLCCLLVFRQKRGLAEEIKKTNESIKKCEDDVLLEKEIKELTSFLHQAYNALGASDFEEFKKKLEEYRKKESQLNVFRTKIEAKRWQLENNEYEDLQQRLFEQELYVNKILESCACKTPEEFLKGQENYRNNVLQKNNLEKEKNKLNVKQESDQKNMRELEKNIYEYLYGLNIQNVSIDTLKEIIEELSEKINQKKETEKEIDSIKNIYYTVLKNRDQETIKKELGDFIPEETDKMLEDEKTVDSFFQEIHQQLFAIQEQIADVSHDIQKKEESGRNVDQVEEELSQVSEKIRYYERKIRAIDVTLQCLKEAFQEIQKDFGPKLNKKVGNILEQITEGKYEDLKISEDYQVRVTDPIEKEMREIDYFSNGTWDQIYFALRLGIIQMIFEEDKKPFLLLDDAFVQYDDNRLEAALDYLYEYSKENQVLLFTCQQRESNQLKEYENINFISI